MPELLLEAPLVLDLSTVADIYLGVVSSWNNSAIWLLNPSLADMLPHKTINVFVSTSRPEINIVLVETLSQASQAFKDAVCLFKRTHSCSFSITRVHCL